MDWFGRLMLLLLALILVVAAILAMFCPEHREVCGWGSATDKRVSYSFRSLPEYPPGWFRCHVVDCNTLDEAEL